MKKKIFAIFSELAPLVLIHILVVITLSMAIGATEYFIFRLFLNISFSTFCLSIILPAALAFLCLELATILLYWIVDVVRGLRNSVKASASNILFDKIIDFLDFSTLRFIAISLLGLTAGALLIILMEKIIHR